MSTIKSSDEHLTLNADGSSKDIKFQANGVEKASISSAGAFTSTTIDATKLTGNLPAISGASLTGLPNGSQLDHSGTKKIEAVSTGAQIQNRLEVITANDSSTHLVQRLGSTDGSYGYVDFELVTPNSTATDLPRFDMQLGNATVMSLCRGGNVKVPSGKLCVGTSTTTSILNVNSTDTSNFAVTINGARASGGSGSMVDFHENSFGGNRIGTITSNGSAIAYNTSSDYRLKENVDYTWDATTRLKQLKPARFNFIADETNTLVDGFIAHEVSSIVPEAVTGEKNAMAAETFYTADDVETQGDSPTKLVGDVKTYSSTKIAPQGIDQSKLVPLLVKTIQELEARITALES